jgi:hypothetical protein
MLKSMKARALCDECRRSLLTEEGILSAEQFVALDRLFSLAGKVISGGIHREERPKVFIGSSTEGIRVANKLQEMLASDFSVIVWNQGTVFGLGTSTLEGGQTARVVAMINRRVEATAGRFPRARFTSKRRHPC